MSPGLAEQSGYSHAGILRGLASQGVDLHNDDSPVYRTDEFRTLCFKVLPCSKRFCHDWTTCPFAHPAEKAKRRDPRMCHYTGVACPEMKKNGMCPRGEGCSFAHNVFEYWLHPSRYRTQLCNDGIGCRRKICFFAHTVDELRVSNVRVRSGTAASSFADGTESLDPFATAKPTKGSRRAAGQTADQRQAAPQHQAHRHKQQRDEQQQQALLEQRHAQQLQQQLAQFNAQLMLDRQQQQQQQQQQAERQAAVQLAAFAAAVQQQQQQEEQASILQLTRALGDLQLPPDSIARPPALQQPQEQHVQHAHHALIQHMLRQQQEAALALQALQAHQDAARLAGAPEGPPQGAHTNSFVAQQAGQYTPDRTSLDVRVSSLFAGHGGSRGGTRSPAGSLYGGSPSESSSDELGYITSPFSM